MFQRGGSPRQTNFEVKKYERNINEELKLGGSPEPIGPASGKLSNVG
jgi:hypothetical protein